MIKSKLRLFVATFFGLLLISLSFSTVICNCSETKYIYVYPINNPCPWRGMTFNSYYAGEVYIDIRDSSQGNNPGGETARAYCIHLDGVIYTHTEYPVTLESVSDTEEWREIAYILTWYDPPENDTVGVWIQGALWFILNNRIPNFIPNEYHGGIMALVNEAANKDVIRENDIFEWITPVPGNNTYIIANPGDTITLEAKITNSTDHPRSGVKVEFSITGGGYLNTVVGWTNSEGIVTVEVTVPNHVADIEVKASTRGVWPQKYIYLGGNRQNLLGIDTTYELTVSTNIWIIANIHVIPELPFGTLAAVATCLFAYLVKSKLQA